MVLLISIGLVVAAYFLVRTRKADLMNYFPLVVLFGGLGASILIFAFIWSRARAEQIETELASEKQRLAVTLNSIDEGVITTEHLIAELGEVVNGTQLGRSTDDEITVFKSLGLAVEDVAALRHIYERAVATGQGTSLDLGGSRH